MPDSREPFIGRNAELAHLQATFEAVCAGRPSLVWIEGPAGIGKTALLRRFLARAQAHTALWANSGEDETLLPWAVVDQLLTSVPPPGIQLAQRLRASLGQGTDPLTTALGTAEVLRSLDDLLGPVVVVLDDAQWADRGSAQALRLAFRHLAHERVLVLVAVRVTQADGAPEDWAHLVADSDRASQIGLTGLSTSELAELAQRVGRPLQLAAARRLRAHTDGNPLYTRELLAQLDPAALSASHGNLPAPHSVDGMIGRRLADCSAPADDLVQAVAVLSGPVRLDLAAAVAGLDDGRVALAEASSARLLVEVSGLPDLQIAFPHALVSAAVYSRLPCTRRAELHARAAHLCGESVRLHHRVAATRGSGGGPAKALVNELKTAARDEATAGKLALAAKHLEQAADLNEDVRERSRLMLSAAELLLASGDAAGAQARVPDSGGADPRADLLAGQLHMLVGDTAVAERRLQTSWALAREGAKPALAARAAAALALLSVTRGRTAETALWAARTDDGPAEATAQGIFAGCLGLVLSGESATGLARLGTCSQASLADPAWLLTRGVLRLWTDDVGGACADLQAGLDVAHEPSLQLASHMLTFLAEAEYRRGDWDQALMHAELAASISTEFGRVCDGAVAHAIAARPLVARGDWTGAEIHIRLAAKVADRVGTELLVACVARSRAALVSAQGDHASALAAVRAADAVCTPREPAFFPDGPLEADALISLGRLDEANAALTSFEHGATAAKRSSALAGAARARGRLSLAGGRPEAALAHFESGLAHLDGLAMPFAKAELYLDLARALVRNGDPEAAGQQLRRGRDTFSSLLARPHVLACDALSQQLGPSRKPEAPLDKVRLTPAEARVAGLVVAGKSNKEVAEQLCVAVKTVEFHLSRIYAKLQVSRRSQLHACMTGSMTTGSAPADVGNSERLHLARRTAN